jgi:hypothetical protein
MNLYILILILIAVPLVVGWALSHNNDLNV